MFTPTVASDSFSIDIDLRVVWPQLPRRSFWRTAAPWVAPTRITTKLILYDGESALLPLAEAGGQARFLVVTPTLLSPDGEPVRRRD